MAKLVYFHKASGRFYTKVTGKQTYLTADENESVALAKKLVADLAAKQERETFPLKQHRSGWRKKIAGSYRYFGTDKAEALRRYEEELPYWQAGEVPPSREEAPLTDATVGEACNHLLGIKDGTVKGRHFSDLIVASKISIDHFGRSKRISKIKAHEFSTLHTRLASKYATSTVKRTITNIKSIFTTAYEDELTPHPVKFGKVFKAPTKKQLRLANQEKKRDATREELRALLDAADDILRAMILLGVNCATANSDISVIQQSAIDFETGWLQHRRHKNGELQRSKVWDETIEAVRKVIASRPVPNDPELADNIFVTCFGNRFGNPDKPGGPVSTKFARLRDRLGLKRAGLTYYSCRHTVETIGGDYGDQVAVNQVMGHVDDSMAANYRNRIEDARLEKVSQHVHNWLFG